MLIAPCSPPGWTAAEATLAVLHRHSFVTVTGDTVERAFAVIQVFAINTRKHHCGTALRAWRTSVARVWKMRISRHGPGTPKKSHPMRWRGLAQGGEFLGQNGAILRQGASPNLCKIEHLLIKVARPKTNRGQCAATALSFDAGLMVLDTPLNAILTRPNQASVAESSVVLPPE